VVTIDDLKRYLMREKDVSIATAVGLIGIKAQQYDVKSSTYKERQLFSIPVNRARIGDIALSALGKPKIDDYTTHRARIYYIGKKSEEFYKSLILNKYIKSELCQSLVKIIDDNYFQNTWERQIEILYKIGVDTKNTYQRQEIYDKMRVQLDAISLVSHILTNFPDVETKNVDIPIPSHRLMSTISRLESLLVIDVSRSGVLVPQIAIEVHGDHLFDFLDKNLEDPFLRYIVSLIFKMPGTGLKNLIRYVPPEKHMELSEVLQYLKKKHIIMILRYAFAEDSDFIIFPVTVASTLINLGNRIICEPDTFRKILTILRDFWEAFSFDRLDTNIHLLKELLSKILRKQGFNTFDLKEYDKPFYRVIFSLAKVGGVFINEGEFFRLINADFVKSLLDILDISHSKILETPTFQELISVELSDVLRELDLTFEEVKDFIEKIIDRHDLKKFYISNE